MGRKIFGMSVACIAIFANNPVRAGDFLGPFPITPGDISTVEGVQKVTVREVGPIDSDVIIVPTGRLIDGAAGIGNPVGEDIPLIDRRFGTIKDAFVPGYGHLDFVFDRFYTNVAGETFEMTDYHQQLGDPAILSAAAFVGGDSVGLYPWLLTQGYVDSNRLIQPDFFSVDPGIPMFIAVDLALLGNAGALFASTHSFGDMFTVDASNMLPDLPGVQFSSSFPLMGTTGWIVTPLAVGTQVIYDGQHETSSTVIPEPATWLSLLTGFGLLGAALRRRRSKVRVRWLMG